jgi:hypothetical protein
VTVKVTVVVGVGVTVAVTFSVGLGVGDGEAVGLAFGLGVEEPFGEGEPARVGETVSVEEGDGGGETEPGFVVPVPLSATFWGEPAASSEKLRIAVRLPAAPGTKMIFTAQLAPGFTVALPQASEDTMKSPALVPEMPTVPTVSTAVPPLARVSVSPTGVPSSTVPKLSGTGLGVAWGVATRVTSLGLLSCTR